jgi:hypothetical protein
MPNSKLPELIKLFLEINPTPSDEQFHNLAFSVGTDPETLESYAYQMLSEAEGAGLGHEMHPATAGTGDATKRSIDQRVLDGSLPPEAGGSQQVAAQTPITEFERTSNGYVFSGVVPTASFTVSLEPYTVIWKYWANNNAAMVYQESADLWIINPSIMTAVGDVKAKIAKARATLYGSPDLLFPTPTILTWLRRGMDAFNGAYGQFTSFTMTNARGPIREYWLLYAELAAIQSQYLAEGEKAFNYQGAAISLEVDRTQYLETAARDIQSRLDSEIKDVKVNLIIKGNTSGDGSADPTKLQTGAIGAVGISITPASMWGRFSPGYGLSVGGGVANSY